MKRQGFTLIELLLSMAFISVLLLAIALVAIQAGKIYNRGLILRDVNQAGRDISDTIRRDFINANQAKFVSSIEKRRFCLGGVSYIWNTPAQVKGGGVGTAPIVTKDGKPINFMRVEDVDGLLCTETNGALKNTLDGMHTTSLLGSDVGRPGVLMIHDMSAVRLTENDKELTEGLFKIIFTVGTSELEEITSVGNCKAPDEEGSNLDFCAINNFEMIVRTNGQ